MINYYYFCFVVRSSLLKEKDMVHFWGKVPINEPPYLFCERSEQKI
ncbi:MAG: hypothetical protein U5L45_00060 [Saprospiraceae bacterium]|nr:hypothetical protein [Saprospiraceae bacterium]